MDKRLYICFIPVFLLIFDVINSKPGNYEAYNKSTLCFNISDNHRYPLPYSVNLQKENNHKPQNVFRIKAKQDVSPMIISLCHIVVLVEHYDQPFYNNYTSPTFSIRLFLRELRGPPVV